VQFNNPLLLYLKTLGLGLLGALLVYQLVAAVRAGLGDMYAAPAMLYMLEANDNQFEITPADQQAIEISLNRGLAFAPYTPEYLGNLGWLQQYRMAVDEESLDDAEWLRLSTLAYESYAKAVAQRPTWPYDWGDMALEQYSQVRFGGAEYNQALVNAARFGPWEDDTQVIVAELALDTWEYLRPEARQATLATIDRGLRRQPGVMIEIIEAYRDWPALCSAEEGDGAALPYLRAKCQGRLAQEPGT
jgi:hypothetical protein